MEDILGDVRADKKVEAVDITIVIFDVKEDLAVDVMANTIDGNEQG